MWNETISRLCFTETDWNEYRLYPSLPLVHQAPVRYIENWRETHAVSSQAWYWDDRYGIAMTSSPSPSALTVSRGDRSWCFVRLGLALHTKSRSERAYVVRLSNRKDAGREWRWEYSPTDHVRCIRRMRKWYCTAYRGSYCKSWSTGSSGQEVPGASFSRILPSRREYFVDRGD
jgi:hypothetical protein